jgi:hypothetical protein
LIKLKKIKTAWGPSSTARSEPLVDRVRTVLTSLRQQLSPHHPPFPPPRPLPLAAIKGAHPPWSDLFLLRHLDHPCTVLLAIAKPPRTSQSNPSPIASTTPQAPRHHVRPSHTASCRPPRPDAPPPPPFPSGHPHLTELILPVSFFLPATPKLVHHPTALLPGPSPLHLVAGTTRIWPGHCRPTPWERSPLL